MSELINIIAVPIATGMMGIILYKLKHMDAQRDKAREESAKDRNDRATQIKANSEGVKVILRYMITRYHDEAIINGYVTTQELRDWTATVSAYEALGGNEILERYEEDISHLPIRDDLGPRNPYKAILKKMKEGEEQ